MRLHLLLPLAAVLLPPGNAHAAFVSVRTEPVFSLKLAAELKAPPAKSAAQAAPRKKTKKKKILAPAIAQPAQPLPEPRLLLPPTGARIVPNGMLSATGPVKPIGSSGKPITPNGILSISRASPVIHLQPVNEATREAESAQLELAQFLYYDYPLQLRQFDSQMVVTQAEIAALERRLANYSRFDKFINNANPLFESQQLASVALVDARQRLANLQYERGRIQQWLPVEIRRRQLDLHRALSPSAPAPAAKAQVPYDATFDDDQER